MNDEFSRFHPLVNIVFYICVLGITMFQMKIVLIIISFIVALIYYIFLKKEWQKTLLDIVSNLFCLLFFGVLAVYGTIYLQKLALHPQKSPTVMINMMIPYAGVLIGIFLMVIRILQMLVEDIRKLCQSQRGGDGHE